MTAGTIENLRTRYLMERPQYKDLSEHVAKNILSLARSKGLRCEVKERAKDVSSFLKKALKGKYDDPYSQIKDKAGVRVIALYPWNVKEIENIVQEAFEIQCYEDKRVGIPFQNLDYRGTHFEIKSPTAPQPLRNLLCEVQVLTKAESLWADTAHYLSYKPPQPSSVNIDRSIYRLIALLEIFDAEVERAYEELRSGEGFKETQWLITLEEQHFQFTAEQGHRGLSLEILTMLVEAIPSSVLEYFESSITGFVSRNQCKLTEFYERYRDDDRANPLVFQPEILLIFLLLEIDAFKLKEAWQKVLPLELLVSLADEWGKPI